MELNREKIVEHLEEWAKNFEGKATNFVTLCNAIALIKKLIEENENSKLQYAGFQGATKQIITKLTEENERIRVVADMSNTTLYDGLRIVKEFCDSRIKRAISKLCSELYEEFLKVARCQKADEPNMRSQEVFAILKQKKELLEEMYNAEKENH